MNYVQDGYIKHFKLPSPLGVFLFFILYWLRYYEKLKAGYKLPFPLGAFLLFSYNLGRRLGPRTSKRFTVPSWGFPFFHVIPGVTDHNYITNSYQLPSPHVDFVFSCKSYWKINKGHWVKTVAVPLRGFYFVHAKRLSRSQYEEVTVPYWGFYFVHKKRRANCLWQKVWKKVTVPSWGFYFVHYKKSIF